MEISVNPVLTTNAAGLFNVQSRGMIQGVAMDDPAVRNQLAGGYVAANAVIWGGMAINEKVPGTTPDPSLGPAIIAAASATGANAFTGFSVFNQAHHMANSPQSPVPLAGQYMSVNFYRFGSLARIPVKCHPSLITLEGDIITTQVSWDFVNQQLVPFNAAWAANVITAAVWSGGQVTLTTTTNHGIAVGSVFTVTGMVPAAYNGTFVALAGTATDQLVYALADDPGADTVQGQVEAGGGALPCKILEVQADNNMTVDYDSTTGFATWDRDGCAALIQI